MKTSLVCLAVAVALRATFDFAAAQEVVTPKTQTRILGLVPGSQFHRVTLSSSIHSRWLVVDFHGYKGDEWNGSYVNLVSDFKPIVKKLPSGKYEIVFVSEIAEDLP